MSHTHNSPFFNAGGVTEDNALAIIHLKRDHLVPVVLQSKGETASGYTEGNVVNTRFGSFPHSTLIGLPWGSQVAAKKVDTGSRGRPGGKKRKREDLNGDDEPDEGGKAAHKEFAAASSGFVHVVPPTPEAWTTSLPHRTQVVYTPDYSYILQRLQTRPGCTILEAGAGSGSFTHAAARAVFNGYPPSNGGAVDQRVGSRSFPKFGKVFSYEYHESRAQQIREEIRSHGLDGIVTVIMRDVYQDGFAHPSQKDAIEADAVFLDLPAPWLALKHLTRGKTNSKSLDGTGKDSNQTESNPNQENESSTDTDPTESSHHTGGVLNPQMPTRLCAFSPCIEQVQRMVSELRKHGWVDVEMVEVLHKRLDVRRERVGLHEEGLRGVTVSAATVEEAVGRLRQVETRLRAYHETGRTNSDNAPGKNVDSGTQSKKEGRKSGPGRLKQERLEKNRLAEHDRKTYKEGRLTHRTESELRTHTSYLTFAILPREWTTADEEQCQKLWPPSNP